MIVYTFFSLSAVASKQCLAPVYLHSVLVYASSIISDSPGTSFGLGLRRSSRSRSLLGAEPKLPAYTDVSHTPQPLKQQQASLFLQAIGPICQQLLCAIGQVNP